MKLKEFLNESERKWNYKTKQWVLADEPEYHETYEEKMASKKAGEENARKYWIEKRNEVFGEVVGDVNFKIIKPKFADSFNFDIVNRYKYEEDDFLIIKQKFRVDGIKYTKEIVEKLPLSEVKINKDKTGEMSSITIPNSIYQTVPLIKNDKKSIELWEAWVEKQEEEHRKYRANNRTSYHGYHRRRW